MITVLVEIAVVLLALALFALIHFVIVSAILGMHRFFMAWGLQHRGNRSGGEHP